MNTVGAAQQQHAADGASRRSLTLGVTSGRGQPTLTIEALAFRAADGITALAQRAEISA